LSDPRWQDVDADAESAARYFRLAAELYDAGGFEADGLEGFRAQMAFMHAVQSAHTTLEAVLLRILDILGETRPSGERWHSDLIARACREMTGPNARPAILSASMCEAVNETRRFRNLAVRNYENFNMEKAKPTVASARWIAQGFLQEINSFRELVDGD
jgi:hypothetical protein